MNKYNPLVSIVIPVFNGSNFISQAIESALSQTYKNIEIIVVNDGSNDEGKTREIALSYGEKIRYFEKENEGVSSALNLGIVKMQGEYFSWLSHDDLYFPDKILQEVKSIKTSDDIVLCCGKLIDKNKKDIKYKTKKLQGRYCGSELFKKFIKGYHLNGLGFLIPKKAFEVDGMFDETMRFLQDTDLWVRMMQNPNNIFVCLNTTLVITRVHQLQVTNTSWNKYEIDKIAMAKKHMSLISDKKDLYTDKMLELYYLLFTKDDTKIGKDLAKKELKKRKSFTLSLLIKSFLYKIKGLIKSIFKKAYWFLLKVKKLR